eukprot:TRINITY_DN15012_c0_g1_i1.p1 TRINITY_DN15012_c0_g1~~TRINITY_DN15012_c0_g1_i1.p1  ORF type:complete len:210 (-),score=20.47 TRINITY_DN15012_c0_g1_i1:129-758(-)
MLILFALLPLSFFQGNTAIECYSCYVKPPPRAPGSVIPEFETLCSTFDQSEEYIVNCTQSTQCMTRTFRLQHRQGSKVGDVVIVERGCAMQAYEHQALVRGKWRTIITIMEEAYSTGCVSDREWAGALASDTEYCYCDEDRCNDKMADEVELNTTEGVMGDMQGSLEHQPGYYQYNYQRNQREEKSGCDKMELSWIVKCLIISYLFCRD